MTQRFNYVVCSVEELNDLDKMTIDELQSSLLVHEDGHIARDEQEARYLDSGCNNHMCGHKMSFSNLDETFRHSVKLGNNSKMGVMGKGNIQLEVDGVIQTVTNVYYVPDLKNNLLSIGQLQEKSLAILIQHGECKLYHPDKELIMLTKMTENRMFKLSASVVLDTSRCL
ncbi:uncharacterized protein LOC141719904 [Apium graveolens]|uniref:uncharacterized protein LOC141719904 n=1 Tax=Apium graveolens TaxID=4045 RepID=UPI003D7A47F0